MWYKIQAFAVIGCGVAIAAGIMYSIFTLFALSPIWGITGCVVLGTSGAATLKVLG